MANIKCGEVQKVFVWKCPEEVCGHHLNIVTDWYGKPVTEESQIGDSVTCGVCNCEIPTDLIKSQSPSAPTDNQPNPPNTKAVPKLHDLLEILLHNGDSLATDSASVSKFTENGLTDRLSIMWPSSNFQYEFRNVANRLIENGRDRFGSVRFKLTMTPQEELEIRLHRLEFESECTIPWQEGFR